MFGDDDMSTESTSAPGWTWVVLIGAVLFFSVVAGDINRTAESTAHATADCQQAFQSSGYSVSDSVHYCARTDDTSDSPTTPY